MVADRDSVGVLVAFPDQRAEVLEVAGCGGASKDDLDDGRLTVLCLPGAGPCHRRVETAEIVVRGQQDDRAASASHETVGQVQQPSESRSRTLSRVAPEILVRVLPDDELPLLRPRFVHLWQPSVESELVLVICDRAFAENGDFLYPSLDPTLTKRVGAKSDYMEGALGDVILVNGAPWPVARVANTRYHLRILNASNARRYNLQLHANRGEPSPSFTQIGSNGGLPAEPQQLASIPIASAERFDVIIDFSQYPVGTEVVLSNSLDKGSGGQVMRLRNPRCRAVRPDTTLRLRQEHREPEARHRRAVALQHQLGQPPRPCAPRALPGPQPRRPPARPLRRRLERHRQPHPGRPGRGPHQVHRLQRPLHAPLPQPRARGHGDDGELHCRLSQLDGQLR